jgi:hypothetical protein
MMSWVMQLIVLVVAAYGGYAFGEGVNNHQLIWAVFGIAALTAAWGLQRNSRWSQYVIYVIAAMLTISWAVGVWRLTAEGWLRDHPADAVLALVPGAVSVLVSVALILAVFKHFHPAKSLR